MPRAPCVSPKQPLILRSVTVCAHQSGVGHGVTQQHCLFPAASPWMTEAAAGQTPSPTLITSSISLLPRSPCSPATGAAGLSEQSTQEPVPREWSPGRPFSLHTLPTPECHPGPGTAGYLFPPSPCPSPLHRRAGTLDPLGGGDTCGLFVLDGGGEEAHSGLQSTSWPPDRAGAFRLGLEPGSPSSPFTSCLAPPPGGRGVATHPLPLEPEGWAGREEGQKPPHHDCIHSAPLVGCPRNKDCPTLSGALLSVCPGGDLARGP